MSSGPRDERRFAKLWRRPTRRWLLGIPAGGFLMFGLGALALGGYHVVMEATSNEAFCAGACHEMRTFVAPEYFASAHGSTRTGVHATCPDCHLPEAFGPKMARKIEATTHEVWHWMRGTIDTREKFEARRAFLAERVWARMTETDSRECRGCHSADRMDLSKQDRFARRKHETAERDGRTCIDCHQGVAHRLPGEADEAPDEPADTDVD